MRKRSGLVRTNSTFDYQFIKKEVVNILRNATGNLIMIKTRMAKNLKLNRFYFCHIPGLPQIGELCVILTRSLPSITRELIVLRHAV